MIKSKLPNTYPVADPTKHLAGTWWQEIDPTFAGRLAYLAKEKRCILSSNSAYRPPAEQAKLYAQYLEYKRTGKGSIKSAAKPGTSKHEYRLAVDTSTQPVRGMTSQALIKYGLHKPIASEGWHIEPIETRAASWRKYEPEEVKEVETQKVTAEMNGRETPLTSILYKGENYVRLRDLAEAQKDDRLTVDWDQARKKVVINSK